MPLIPIETIMLDCLQMCSNWSKSWQMIHRIIKQVWKPRRSKNWTILPKVLDFLFMNKVHLEKWSSTSVFPTVVADTTTLQNFSLTSFWSLLLSLENVIHFHYTFTIISIISPPFHYYVTTFIPLPLSLDHIYVFPNFIILSLLSEFVVKN